LRSSKQYEETSKHRRSKRESRQSEIYREFIVKDNVGFGEWDWDILANEWNTEQLGDWGMDLPAFDNPIEDDQPDEINEDDNKEICPM
jgi:hypothetical protein